MVMEKAEQQSITLYPSQIEKVERLMRKWKMRKFAQAVQRIIDDFVDPGQVESAEKPDTGQDGVLAGNIGA